MKLKEENLGHYDVVIIGGGPAGCAAGLTLLNKTSLDACVIESTDYTNMRVGESVAPGIMPLMRYLGIDGEFLSNDFLPSHGIDAAWGTEKIRSRDFFFSGQGHGWNLDRKRFDSMMGNVIKKRNGTLFTTTKIIEQKKKGNLWSLTILKNGGVKSSITCNFVIDASGRNAFFARNNNTSWHVLDYLVGVASVYAINDTGEKVYTLIESVPDGWWYSTLLPNNQRMVVFMTDSDIAKRIKIHDMSTWNLRLKNTRHIHKTIEHARLTEGPAVFPAYSRIIRKIPMSDWVPAGDAMASFDPLSSVGIGHAIVSGIEAARVANNVLKSNGCLLESYIDGAIRNFSDYVKNKTHFYNLEKRWQDKPFWNRRQNLN